MNLKNDLCLKSFVVHESHMENRFNTSRSPSNTPLSDYKQLANIISHSPGIVSFKNNDSVFIGCSQRLAELGNVHSSEKILGKHDSELPWGKNGYTEIFREEDKSVLTGKILYVLGRYYFSNGEKTVIVKKSPVLDKKDNIIGLVNHIIELGSNLLEITQMLSQFKIHVSQNLIDIIKRHFLNGKTNSLNLSLREEECVYYLIRGYSIKQIARTLDLSPRTIEFYIDNIKEKLKCNKMSALIVKAIKLGYLDNIPSSIFSA